MKYSFVICTTLSILFIVLLLVSAPATKAVDERGDSILYQESVQKIKFLESLVDKYPTYFEGHIRLSTLYLSEGNTNKAVESLRKAREINPNSLLVKNQEEILSKVN